MPHLPASRYARLLTACNNTRRRSCLATRQRRAGVKVWTGAAASGTCCEERASLGARRAALLLRRKTSEACTAAHCAALATTYRAHLSHTPPERAVRAQEGTANALCRAGDLCLCLHQTGGRLWIRAAPKEGGTTNSCNDSTSNQDSCRSVPSHNLLPLHTSPTEEESYLKTCALRGRQEAPFAETARAALPHHAAAPPACLSGH